MNTLGDYHDLYLKANVLLLVDVFEKFIKTCSNYYGLDPYHYFSASGLTWDAMLQMTKIELETISDIDVHLFIENGVKSSKVVKKRYLSFIGIQIICMGGE